MNRIVLGCALLAIPSPCPAAVTAFSVSPQSITGGYPATVTISVTPCFSQQCDDDIESVALSSSLPSVLPVPPTVTVDRDKPAKMSITVTSHAVTSPRTITITATSTNVKTATVTVYPLPSITSLTILPPGVVGGAPARGDVVLNYLAPPGGQTVQLTASSYAFIGIPASILVEEGETTASFDITTEYVTSAGFVTITAASGGMARDDTLNVGPTLITDFRLTELELTQTIQDLDNTVPLIAGKPTFVRATARAVSWAPGPIPNITAHLFVRRATDQGWTGPILPGNPGERISVGAHPDRGQRDQSFFFQLPAEFTHQVDTILPFPDAEVCVEVNADDAFPETTDLNNRRCESVEYRAARSVRTYLYRVQYFTSGVVAHFPIVHAASVNELAMMASWLGRAYPTPQIEWAARTLHWPYTKTPEERGCGKVNNLLAHQRSLDGSPARYRYYGMVADSGGYMRGCAAGIPSHTASGPTGPDEFAWDADGSYGDWYGGHEIGHALGLYHAEFCGASGGRPYPYPGGHIGGPASNPDRYFGWDGLGPAVYGPNWTDVMTYCAFEWISDFNYKNLLNGLGIAEPNPDCPPYMAYCPPPWDEWLAIFARVDLAKIKEKIELETFYRLRRTDIEPAIPSAPGPEWAIVLYDKARNELARQAFTPREDTDVHRPGERPASIIESVEWIDGTARIAITFKGEEVASRVVSANAPRVVLRSPRGGETLRQQTTVRWAATDRDGEALTYAVQYSADGGKTWRTLAAELTTTQLPWPVDDLPGSDRALFRVIASDGVNTGMGVTSAAVRVPKKSPQAVIIGPRRREQQSPVSLVGEAFDAEDGSLPNEALSWTSSRDGKLGTGRQLLARLSAGTHAIQLTARDSDGNTASASISLEIRRR